MFRSFCSQMQRARNRAHYMTWLFMMTALFAVGARSIFSAANAQVPQPVQHVVITLDKSVTLPVPRAFSSAVVGSPDIADAMPMTDHILYIQGKSIGTTNVSIYDENMRLIKVVDVEVTLDTGNLQSKIRASTGEATAFASPVTTDKSY